jgi:glucose/arabinose dehydrogenase/PKD repeat protein
MIHTAARSGTLLLFALVVCSLLLFPAPPTQAQTLPTGFSETNLAGDLNRPVALAFTPDGRLLVTNQPGQVRLIQNNTLVTTPVLSLTDVICSNSERGILGVAIDPNFATNNYIYLYYTFKRTGDCTLGGTQGANHPVNRVSRFTLPNTNVINRASEVVLIDNIRSDGGNHNGGDLHFGPDNLLYISVGDAAKTELARDSKTLSGKMLRINPSQTNVIPPNNPYANTAGVRRCGDPAGIPAGDGPCGEIIAQGLRNPFRFAIDPTNGRLHINDVGDGTWEEVNLWEPSNTGVVDYGWPVREGNCTRGSRTNCSAPPAGMTNPIHAYDHNIGCASITGGAFVPLGVWPASFDNSYLFGDYVCGKVFQMKADRSVNLNSPFLSDLGRNSIVTMIFGPHNSTKALYYTTIGGDVNRLEATGGNNRAPTAKITANPSSGAAPLNVQFSATGSADPDGDPLTYDWNFGNGQTLNGSTQSSPQRTYNTGGVYTATLVVRDNRGGVSQPATVRIDVGNSPPVPKITAPTLSKRFTVGETLTLTGSATDKEDGNLASSRLTWEVRQHHLDVRYPDNRHFHPWLAPTTGNNIKITAPAPEDVFATPSYLEILLTATDSLGRSTTITQTVRPQQVNLTLRTEPAGLQLIVNEQFITSTAVISSWVGYKLITTAPFQVRNGKAWMFDAWADASTNKVITTTRTITTTTQAASYTARFRPAPALYLPMILNKGTNVQIEGLNVNEGWAVAFAQPAGASRWICELPGLALATRPEPLPVALAPQRQRR